MKRILSALLVLLVLGFGAFYLFIPTKLEFGDSRILNVPLNAVNRSLSGKNTWEKWWPGSIPFVYDGMTFSVYNNVLNTHQIEIIDGKDSNITLIEISSIATDTTFLDWKGRLLSSINPLERIARYRKAIRIKKNISILLDHLKSYFETPENIYGLRINLVPVTDSALITTRKSLNYKPGVKDINELVQRLRTYIIKNKGKEKNFPMLNIKKTGSNNFDVMVAIPVDRQLPETKEFIPKFLLKGGKILEAEVRGGPYAIETAFKELENYKADFEYDSPAIPYQLMVTDRMKVTDTSAWVTKLYYPIY